MRGMGSSLAMPHPWPNIAVEPTPTSIRSYLAPAGGRGSPLAFGCAL